jgi:hypothetical protein
MDVIVKIYSWARCPEDPAAPSTLVRPEPIRIKISIVPPCARAKLYMYDFASAADASHPPTPVLKVGFLLWAPLTGDIKSTALAEKDAPATQEFSYLAKDVFIDHYLAVRRDLSRESDASIRSGGALFGGRRASDPRG